MGLNIDLSGLFGAEERRRQRALEQQRMQQQMMLAEADQVLQTKARDTAERERQAKLADTETKAFNERVAGGMPADDALKIMKATYKAYGLDASPSVKPVDPNRGGGYEYSGFMPGQEEPWRDDPKKRREGQAARQAALMASMVGVNPEAQGLMPSWADRAQSTPAGQQYVAGVGRELAAAEPGPGGLLSGMAAIAGRPSPGAALAPTDPVTAAIHQSALGGDDLALAEKFVLQEAARRGKAPLESMKEEGRNTRAAMRAAGKGRGGPAKEKWEPFARQAMANDRQGDKLLNDADKMEAGSKSTALAMDMFKQYTGGRVARNSDEAVAFLTTAAANKRAEAGKYKTRAQVYDDKARAVMAGTPAAAPAATAATVVVTDGKSRRTIPASRLAEALKKGWKQE